MHGKFNFFLTHQLFNLPLKVNFFSLIPVVLLFVKSLQIREKYEVKRYILTLVGRVYFPSGRGTL